MRRLLVVTALAAAACSRCEKQTGAPTSGVERVLPSGANAYVIIPSVERLGAKLLLLEGLKVVNFAVQPAGVENAHLYVDAVVQEMGIDPRSKEQLDKIGIAAGSSAGVALMDGEGTALVALPIKDEGRVAAFIRTYSANRLGASVVEDKTENGVTIHRLMGAVGPKLAWASVHGYALIVPQTAVDKLAGWASRPEGETLAKDVALPASLGRLPAERDAIVYAPPVSRAMLGLPVSHVVMTLSLTPDAFTFTADAPWGDKAGLSMFEPKAGPSLVGLLPADAFLVARFAGDPAPLVPYLLPLLGSHLQKALSEGGLDLGAALGQLAPGSVMGVSLAPTAQMGRGMPDLDVRRSNPFSFVHLTGVAPAKSADAAGPVLEKLAEVAPRFGAKMTLKDGVYVTTYSQGEGVHFAVKGDRVMFGSPLPRVQALLSADGSGPGLGEALKGPLESSAIAMVVDLRKLSDSVRDLPPSAWGVGGFAIKATTVRWLDNSDDLKAITVNVGAKGGAVQGTVKLMLGAAPARAAGDAGP